MLERCALALCTIAALAAPPAAAEAAPAWSQGGAVGDGLLVSVGADAAGNALVGYADDKRVLARERSAAGQLGPEVLLTEKAPGTQMHQIEVEVASDGSAAIAWVEIQSPSADYHLWAATRPAGGPLGPAQLIATDLHARDRMSLSVANGGWAAVAWDHGYSTEFVEASIHAPGLPTFGAPEKVSSNSMPIDTVSIAIDSQGRAIAAWDDFGKGPKVSVRSLAGTWSPEQALAPPRYGSTWPSVAVDGNGNALAVFMNTAGTPDAPRYVMDARYRPVDGNFGAIEQASQPADRGAFAAGSYFWPSPIGFDGAGNATVLWRATGSTELFATTRSKASGGFGAADQLSASAANDARLSVGAAGAAFAAWQPPQPGPGTTYPPPPLPLHVAVRPAGGTFGQEQVLAPDAENTDVAAAGAGNAIAVWSVRYPGSTCGQVRFAVYSTAPSTAPAPGAPACVPQQQPPDGQPGGEQPGGNDPLPQPPTPPQPQPKPDTTAPALALSAARRQRPLARRRVSLSATCDEDCSANVRATIKVGRRRMALRPLTKALAAGRRTTLTLKLGAKDARRLRAALAARRRLVAITVVATDAAGNGTTRKRSIAITR